MPTREEAIAAATEIASRGWAELAQAYAEGGAEAVAELAWEPGGPSKAEIAATYEQWVQEAMQQRDAAKGNAAPLRSKSRMCSTRRVSDVVLPPWWAYPERCGNGHLWGPGRVIVSWHPCQ